MTEFKKWLRQAYREPHTTFTEHNMEVAYLAGQASAEERVKELEELVDRQQGFLSYWKAKCAELQVLDENVKELEGLSESRLSQIKHYVTQIAELERERDEHKAWRDTHKVELNWLKAQAGKPVCWIYELSGYRSIAWGSSKPDFPAAKNPVPLYTHPTTERPYNPLNDYAIISMNPTEPVKAQAGEPVAWMNKRGDVISAEEKTLIIENGKLGYPGGEFDLHAKNIERSYTIPLGVINV